MTAKTKNRHTKTEANCAKVTVCRSLSGGRGVVHIVNVGFRHKVEVAMFWKNISLLSIL